MINPRAAAAALAFALFFAAATDYVPAFNDMDGKVFGLFRLDVYKDALHVASGAWAAVSALLSRRAAKACRRAGVESQDGTGWHKQRGAM